MTTSQIVILAVIYWLCMLVVAMGPLDTLTYWKIDGDGTPGLVLPVWPFMVLAPVTVAVWLISAIFFVLLILCYFAFDILSGRNTSTTK